MLTNYTTATPRELLIDFMLWKSKFLPGYDYFSEEQISMFDDISNVPA